MNKTKEEMEQLHKIVRMWNTKYSRGETESVYSAITGALQEYASQSNGGWIYIMDAMPEGTDPFLVINMNQGGNKYVVWFNPVHKHFVYCHGEFYCFPSNPLFTHWQPLPKPPIKQ